MEETKTCPRCKGEFPRTREHFPQKGGRLGAYCKPCEAAKNREWREQNRARSEAGTWVIPEGAQRKCTSCKTAKPLDVLHFSRHAGMPYGLSYDCRDCQQAASQRAKGENARAYRHGQGFTGEPKHCPDCRTDKPRLPAHWNQNRRAKDGLQNVCRRCQSARQKNTRPSRQKGEADLRRQRVRAAGGTFTLAELYPIYQRQEGRCFSCSADIGFHGWHPDHVVPLSRGGANTADNIVLSCHRCNGSRNNRLFSEWAVPLAYRLGAGLL